MTTEAKKRVKVRTRNVGDAYGTIGEVISLAGRPLAATEIKPFGFTGVARQEAEAIAEAKGWEVIP